MSFNFKKLHTLFLTSAIIIGNYQLNNSNAFADNLAEESLKPSHIQNIRINVNQSQYKDAIGEVTNNYNLMLKSFSGFFKKNNNQELNEINPSTAVRKVISRNGRKIQTTHRSISVGIREDGKIQTGRMIWPTTKVSVMSGYGPRGRSFHHGIDIYDSYGSNVYAVISGTVTFSGWMSGYGKLIEVQHKNGLSTRYAHLSNELVSVGQKVSSGDVIGKVGNTGRVTCTHLHFEVRMNGISVPPIAYLR